MDAFDEAFREPNEAERSARRVLALAIALINARRPLSNNEIHREFYPEMTEPTFRKTFLRDRARLVTAGITLRPTGKIDDVTAWEVDAESSFVPESHLDELDALALDVLLLPLASDPSYPYARDLRLALTKIDRSFDGSSVAVIPPEARKRNNNITQLEDCMTSRHTARITYTRADGSATTRTVAPLGFFFLNDNSYMVAERTDLNHAEPPHTYNLERITKVQEIAKSSFELPADFDIRDFVMLPFQIGPVLYQATFRLSDGSAMQEGVSDEAMAVAWAIAEGATPLEPDSLVTGWQEALADVAETLERDPDAFEKTISGFESGVLGGKTTSGAARMRRSGRKNNNERIRELVSLLGSLSRTGDTVTLDAISTRLGISVDEARDMMNIVCQASGENYGGLLISADEEETEFTLQFPGTTGKPIRLTSAETIALVHALDLAGIAEDDPIRQKLNTAFLSPNVREDEVRHALGSINQTSGQLYVFAQSQVEQRKISFDYCGIKDTEPRRRHALVRTLQMDNGHWYATCFDTDIDQERTFKIDRMTNVVMGDHVFSPLENSREDVQRVEILMTDPLYYHAFDWPTLRVLHASDSVIHGEIAYYGDGSTWLLRRICAGRESITVNNRCIMQLASEYAREALLSNGG